MNYWWVNHKQTHKAEIEGGYIWSPKINQNSSRNQTYLNLTRVEINDIVFSYANAHIQAIGRVSHKSVDSDCPPEFGVTGEQWGKDGWLVRIEWTLLEKPFRPKEYISSISPLLPARNSPIQQNGNGNQGCYLAQIDVRLGELLLTISNAVDLGIGKIIDTVADDILDDEEEYRINKESIAETEKDQLVKARRGQGVFRQRLEKMEKQCRMTGVNDKRMLIASHIKPWRSSNNLEKVDGQNGLLLSPHVDKLFDRGWISFKNSGEVLCSSVEIKSIMHEWGLDDVMNVGSFRERQKRYLEYHRDVLYGKWK